MTASVRVDRLSDTISLLEKYGYQAQEMLTKSGAALEKIHQNLLPQVTTPARFEDLIEAFNAGSNPLASYRRAQTCAGAEAAFMLTIANGVEADFEKIVSAFPKKVINGKPVDLVSAREKAKKLSQEMADMLEARARSKAISKSARSTSSGANSGANN